MNHGPLWTQRKNSFFSLPTIAAVGGGDGKERKGNEEGTEGSHRKRGSERPSIGPKSLLSPISFLLLLVLLLLPTPTQIIKTHTGRENYKHNRVKQEGHRENIKQPGIKGFFSTSTKVNPSQKQKGKQLPSKLQLSSVSTDKPTVTLNKVIHFTGE